MRRALSGILSLAFLLLLGGCAGIRLVDNDVRSFSSLPAVAVGTTYRFERLPSQQTHGAAQEQLEAMAQKALAKVGLQRNDAAPKYSVQIGARMQKDPRAPWDDPWPGWGMHGRDHVVTGSGRVVFMPGFGFGFGRWESPYYRREVSVVMRDLATSKVVYETHASHDGRWSDSEAVFPAMFDAALRGFPQPASGPRRVDVEIGR
ncbi:MAG TPA: DUF4136 domain-containing protein [Burkholderiaceae bacterium]|nr:DUF4136 domain-containing protein [Burkholderiaceae bacterium]